jgi:elongation factor Ts
MAEVSINEIKRLRELTGVGITDAKAALVEAKGDFDKALSQMRKKGLTKAEKRAEREARAGLIGSYVHDGRIGVLVEVNCETDFVAKTDEFKELVKDLSLHIAASAPDFISLDDVNEAAKKEAKEEFSEKAKSDNVPEKMLDQVVEGMLKKHFAEKSLLEQPFVKNPDQTVGDYVKEANAKLGENIVVRRFSRMVLGEVA